MANDTASDVQGFDDKPESMKKRSKVWIGILVALVVIIGGASLLIPQLLDQAKYKSLIQTKVTEATGYSVDWVGDIGISIFPLPSVHLNELTLSNRATRIVYLKEAEVRVALLPLLSKKVEIASVNLIEPDVTLIINQQGYSTWMTDKLSKESDGAADQPASEGAPASDSAPAEITLNSLKITKGRVLFENQQAKTQQLIENLNADISAESLTGPYTAKGDVTYTEKNIEFDIKAGKLDGNQQGYPVQAKIALPDLKVNGEYSGILATTEDIKVDGELTFAANDLAKTIEAFSGSKPDLPDGLGGATELQAKLVYDGNQALLDKMRLAVGDLSYTGSIAVKDLKSDAPPLAINLVPEKGDVKSSSALVAALSDLSVEGLGSFANNKVTIKNSKIGFRGQTISAAGTYALATAGKRPVIDFTVKADKINVDELTGTMAKVSGTSEKSAAPAKGESAGAAPTGMSLPFDGKLQADIGTLVQGGKIYSPVKADIVSKGNALTINALNVGMAPDTTITAKGSVGNLAALSDFNLTTSVQTSDAEATMKALNITPPEALKQKIGPATINGTFKGSLEQVAFNATLNALRFALTGQGEVGTPMTNPVISSLNFNVKHPQLSDALKTFQPGMDAPPSFKGALDLSGKLAWDKTKVDISDLKGSLGNSSIAGALNIATGGAKPSVKGALNFGDLVFDATKDGGVAGSNTARPAGTPAPGGARWSTEAIDTAWMNSFDADLAIKAKSVTQDLWKLTNANLSFALSNGTLAIRDVSAGMFGGEAKLNGQMTSAPLAVSMAMTATNVDARQLQSALQSKVSDNINGTISSFKVDVKSTGNSPSALVNALSGQGALAGNNIVIKGIDVAQLAETAKGSFKPLERAGSMFQTFQNGQTQFDTMDVAFAIQSGIVNFTKMKLDGDRALIEAKSGVVSLPKWTIDMTNTVTVKGTDIPPFDFTIKGPLDNPLQAGGNIIESYLRDKASKKIEKLIGKELEKRFGIPLGGTQETAPAATTEGAATATPPAEAAPAPAEKVTPEEEAVKALQNLFGR